MKTSTIDMNLKLNLKALLHDNYERKNSIVVVCVEGRGGMGGWVTVSKMKIIVSEK